MKEETVEQEDYAYEGACIDAGEDEDEVEGYGPDVLFPEQNASLPGPSGISGIKLSCKAKHNILENFYL